MQGIWAILMTFGELWMADPPGVWCQQVSIGAPDQTLVVAEGPQHQSQNPKVGRQFLFRDMSEMSEAQKFVDAKG